MANFPYAVGKLLSNRKASFCLGATDNIDTEAAECFKEVEWALLGVMQGSTHETWKGHDVVAAAQVEDMQRLSTSCLASEDAHSPRLHGRAAPEHCCVIVLHTITNSAKMRWQMSRCAS